jgi:hypothetical protein
MQKRSVMTVFHASWYVHVNVCGSQQALTLGLPSSSVINITLPLPMDRVMHNLHGLM